MKILLEPLIFNIQKYGGISRYYAEIFRFLSINTNVVIDLPLYTTENFHLKSHGIGESILINFFGKLFPYRIKNYFILKSYRKTFKLLKFAKYDLFIPTYYDVRFLKVIGKTPFVLTVHDMIHEIYPQLEPGSSIVQNKKLLIELATKIIAVSEHTKKDILKFYPHVPKDKIHVVHLSHSISKVNLSMDYLINVVGSTKYILFVGNRGVYKNFKGQPYEISLETYYKKSSNILDYKVGAELILNEHIETEVLQGEGKSYGIELLLKKTSGRLNGWIGYSYSKSLIKLDSQFNEEVVNNGDYFPTNFDKPHDLSVILNYKFTKRYSLSTNFIYQTGRPITYPIGSYEFGGNQYTLYSDRNEFRVPDYYRLDIGFNIEGNHKIKKLAHSYWNISIYNVLGRNNPYSIYFVTEEGRVKAYQTSIFSIPVPTITYNFKF